MELEVEEDLAALLAYHPHHGRPGMQKELLADLEQAHFARERAYQLLRFTLAGDVEREDQAAARATLAQSTERPTEAHALTT